MIDLDDPQAVAELVQERTLDMGKVLKLASLEQSFLVHSAIPARAVTFVVGTPGARKSWIAYDLALAVSRGRPWLGLASTKAGLRTLILNYDNPTVELARRFLRLGATPDDNIVVHTMTGDGDMLKLPERGKELLAIVNAVMPQLIIVDSLRQSHTGDEGSSKDMAAVMSVMRAMTACGASVVIAHHVRKAPTDPGSIVQAMDTMRGSTELAASADAIISIAVDSDDDGELVSQATWIKTRAWSLPKGQESLRFSVIDHGNTTKVDRL